MGTSDWKTSGTVLTAQSETVWISLAEGLNPFVWLGGCAKLDDGTYNLGDLTVTQQQNPRDS